MSLTVMTKKWTHLINIITVIVLRSRICDDIYAINDTV